MRRALASTMHIDSMGFADPASDGQSAPRSKLPMALSELGTVREGEEDNTVGRARDTSGRFVPP